MEIVQAQAQVNGACARRCPIVFGGHAPVDTLGSCIACSGIDTDQMWQTGCCEKLQAQRLCGWAHFAVIPRRGLLSTILVECAEEELLELDSCNGPKNMGRVRASVGRVGATAAAAEVIGLDAGAVVGRRVAAAAELVEVDAGGASSSVCIRSLKRE